jgi:hypothetical protein
MKNFWYLLNQKVKNRSLIKEAAGPVLSFNTSSTHDTPLYRSVDFVDCFPFPHE